MSMADGVVTRGVVLDESNSFAEWQILQQELADLSSNSQRLVAERSGHVIQFEQPELVVRAVTDMVAALRKN